MLSVFIDRPSSRPIFGEFCLSMVLDFSVDRPVDRTLVTAVIYYSKTLDLSSLLILPSFCWLLLFLPTPYLCKILVNLSISYQIVLEILRSQHILLIGERNYWISPGKFFSISSSLFSSICCYISSNFLDYLLVSIYLLLFHLVYQMSKDWKAQ